MVDRDSTPTSDNRRPDSALMKVQVGCLGARLLALPCQPTDRSLAFVDLHQRATRGAVIFSNNRSDHLANIGPVALHATKYDQEQRFHFYSCDGLSDLEPALPNGILLSVFSVRVAEIAIHRLRWTL